MSGKTKKQWILEIFERESMTNLGEAEARLIQQKLAEVLGPGVTVSRGYIARVVAEAGQPVQISDAFSLPVMEESYRQAFEGLLKFSTLAEAEQSLRQINARYHEFKAASDEKGMAYARAVAVVGKRRAQAAARRATSAEMREVKQEIANWFTLWLSAPQFFEDWLDLRKQSPEFRSKWGRESDGIK
jgi:hypothetical protein